MTHVAYLGIPGSFSYAAANAVYDPGDTYLGVPTFKDIFDALLQHKAEYGIFPIENSLAGSIYENYDLLHNSGLRLQGEYYLHVQHCLLVHKNVAQHETKALAQIKKVYSHPKALEQCEAFFAAHPHIEKCPYSDTATAARFVAEQNDPTIAAIAGPIAASLYDLRILKDHIEDYQNNYTRFLIASKQAAAGPENNKCSLIIRLPHVPGSLQNLLQVLVDHSCNLMKIESRPWRNKPFEYIFYLDFCFDPHAQPIDSVIDDLKNRALELTVLGIYKDQVSLAL